MKGTLLQQLKEEYSLILDNTDKTKAMAAQKNMIVKELEATYFETKARHEKAENLQKAAEKLDLLKAELAWTHIREKEAELSKSVVETETAKSRRKKIEDKIEEAQKKLQECENNLKELETNHSQAASPEELNQQLQELNEKISDGKKGLQDAKV
jgi:structural maintenance of chromosomes protein 6